MLSFPWKTTTSLRGSVKEILRMYSVFHEVSEITKEAAEGTFGLISLKKGRG